MEMEVPWEEHSSENGLVVCSGNQTTVPWRRSMQTVAFMSGHLKWDDPSMDNEITGRPENRWPRIHSHQRISRDQKTLKSSCQYTIGEGAQTIRRDSKENPIVEKSDFLSRKRRNHSSSHGFLHLGRVHPLRRLFNACMHGSTVWRCRRIDAAARPKRLWIRTASRQPDHQTSEWTSLFQLWFYPREQ